MPSSHSSKHDTLGAVCSAPQGGRELVSRARLTHRAPSSGKDDKKCPTNTGGQDGISIGKHK